MPARLANGSAKRKHASEEEPTSRSKNDLPEDVGLEMQSGDEDEEDEEDASEDDEVEEFPEIDAASDSDSEDEEDEEDEAGQDAFEEDTDDGASDDSLHIFPKAKIVQSDITGEPKKVYPEIEPEYDSDSSTEEVSAPHKYYT